MHPLLTLQLELFRGAVAIYAQGNHTQEASVREATELYNAITTKVMPSILLKNREGL